MCNLLTKLKKLDLEIEIKKRSKKKDKKYDGINKF